MDPKKALPILDQIINHGAPWQYQPSGGTNWHDGESNHCPLYWSSEGREVRLRPFRLPPLPHAPAPKDGTTLTRKSGPPAKSRSPQPGSSNRKPDMTPQLSRRDYFAAMAMQGTLAGDPNAGHANVAEWAVGMADELIAQLDGTPNESMRWIPVSERLPEEIERSYLVTLEHSDQHLEVHDFLWADDGTGSWAFWWDEESHVSRPVAWCPLPEPYAPESPGV
jgi:hypothetical protein